MIIQIENKKIKKVKEVEIKSILIGEQFIVYRTIKDKPNTINMKNFWGYISINA